MVHNNIHVPATLQTVYLFHFVVLCFQFEGP